jgi:outer membrane protein TolC
MNNPRIALVALAMFAAVPLASASDPVLEYLGRRFSGKQIEVKDVQGISDRVVDGKLHLHLRDFLELVLKNSTDIHLTRLDVYTAANQITSAKAPFDPAVGLGFNALRSVSPLGYFFNGGSGGSQSGSTGSGGQLDNSGPSGSQSLNQITLPQTINSLSQNSVANYTEILPTGQTITSGFSAYRSSGDSYPFPTIFGTLNFAITQSLLQNRSNIQYLAPLRIARTQLLITSKQSEATIADAVAAAARQYWEAILARDNIRVQQQTVDLARKSYEHDKQALDLGALAKLDIYQSETQVAERNLGLVQAQFQYKAALDGLRRFIGADLTPALRNTEIVLDDDPARASLKFTILPFEQALAKAMQLRPETEVAQQRLSIDNLNARAARDSLLPRLDLSLQGGATGPGLNQIGGGSVVGFPTTPYPGLGATLKQVFAFNYPSYGFGLQFTFPFRNSAGRANLADALVSKARDQYQQRQVEQQIILDVRQAINSMELANASIDVATHARDLARQNANAEQQKYELGSITAFELLDSQSRLANTESALLGAYVAYQEAYISYQRATWTLLDGLGLIVETPKVS